MDKTGQAAQDVPKPSGEGRLTFARTEEVLKGALGEGADATMFERLHLDREAAAAFIADQATLLSAVAHAAGLTTVKILTDLLYVNAFGDASPFDPS